MTRESTRERRQKRGGPALPFVDGRIYTEQDIFAAELATIWRNSWLLVAHESELPNVLDFRTTSFANEPVAVVRGEDGKVRAFLNVCPHRGALLLREPAGNLGDGSPSRAPNRITCMFHAWQFSATGECLSIPRRNAEYQARLQCSDARLHELACEVAYGGFVWVHLDANPTPLREYTLNPLDPGTTATRHGELLHLNGKKSFCSGALDSDRLLVSFTEPPSDKLIVAALPSCRAGIRYNRDWDNMGQRQTDSGSVEFSDVVVHESELLTSPGPLSSPFASLRPCIAQLVLANVYLGIAQGALESAKEYTHTQRRAWPGSGVQKASEDPYVLARYGEMSVELRAARLLCDAAGSALDEAWQRREDTSAEDRGAAALAIAAAKVATTRTSLDFYS